MIFPAIDLMDGGCVRLFQGDFKQRTNYDISPQAVAQSCASDGADWLHIVDLDGAKTGSVAQTELIIDIANNSDIKIQTGGGLRELSHIQRLLDGGVERVVLGSLAVTNPQMVKFWFSELGPEQIVLALDIKTNDKGVPFPTTRGWTDTGDKSLWDTIDDYGKAGLKTILVTDIERDGALVGGNIDLYTEISGRYPGLDLITSGGVGSLEHVKALKKLNPHGIIIGKALYENKFSLSEAIAC